MRARGPLQGRGAKEASDRDRRQVIAIVDSPIARQLVAGAFSKESHLSVVTAFDWNQAEGRLRSASPDIVLLSSDHLWPDDPGARPFHELGIPIVAASLDLRSADVQSSLEAMTAAVRQAPHRRRSPRDSTKVRLGSISVRPPPEARVPVTPRFVAVGASAGGTVALKTILQAMPARAPALVIVQHMSGAFTRTFAEGLDRICAIDVKEAEAGDAIVQGRALIAPGDRHVLVQRRGAEYFVELAPGPLVSRHRPSVNVLFRSVAQQARGNGVGAVLTGMGDDGADGLLEMKEMGALTIAQNEATSAVFGMPRAAILRGGVLHVVALDEMAKMMLNCAGKKHLGG